MSANDPKRTLIAACRGHQIELFNAQAPHGI
jgi:hypothetical protein